MKGIHIFFAFIAAIGMYSTACADETETAGDARCFIVGIQMSRAADASQQNAGLLLALYYLGRLDGMVPKVDLEELLAKETPAMAELAEFKKEAVRCGKALSEKGVAIQQIGQHLTLRGQKMLEKEKATSP